MNVKAILSAKGVEVLTIEPTTNLAAAAKLLAERKIGALAIGVEIEDWPGTNPGRAHRHAVHPSTFGFEVIPDLLQGAPRERPRRRIARG